MPDISFIFEVHQPFRINRRFYQELLGLERTQTEDLFNLYFDSKLNKDIFTRISEQCYLPANNAILNSIDKQKREKRPFKVAYSISGSFIEQCEKWNKDILESFKQLSESKYVEFLEQTYYHSIASLSENEGSEFIEQVRMHQQLMRDLLNCKPTIFENTECLYNNRIGRIVSDLGYKAILTEGSERILGWRSPNFLYKSKYSDIHILLRNYLLSDDVGFRFNSRDWKCWPLTADKYAAWLALTYGDLINVFMDYETFGEHYRIESGILEFLKWLPTELIRWGNINCRTPSEVIKLHKAIGDIDVPEHETVSWADVERDASAWLGNSLQKMSFNTLYSLELAVRDIGDEMLRSIWRHLQTSDHLYYMSTKSGGSGDVHSSFNPYGNPLEAFFKYFQVISDLETRLNFAFEKPEFRHKRILRRLPAEKGFLFFEAFARPTRSVACSIREFYSLLKVVSDKSIEFHMNRRDFEMWINQVIGDEELASEISEINGKDIGENLRKHLLGVISKKIRTMENQ